MLRLFVAIHIPSDVRHALAQLSQRDAVGLRWVKPNNYHITLQFLGDVPVKKLPKVKEAMIRSVRALDATFHLHVGHIGAFPDLQRIRTLWAGVHGDVKRLHQLQRQLADNLVQQGFPKRQRDFHPHVTLARSRRLTSLPHSLRPYCQRTFGQKWAVESIQLVASELLPTGPRYHVRYNCQI